MRRGLALALPWLLAGTLLPAQAGELVIDTALSDDGSLNLSYTAPEGVRSIPLWNHSEATRFVWTEMARPADDCARYADGRIELREGCRVARFTVAPRLLDRYATYEAAQPVGGTGVLMHTTHYAAALPGQALQWRWLPPQGGSVIREGRVERSTALESTIPAETVDAALHNAESEQSWRDVQADRMAYLGRAALLPLPGGVLVRDPDLDEARLTEVRDTLAFGLRRLGEVYGRMPAGPVAVITSTVDMLGFHGDTDGHRMMRLRLDRDAVRFGSAGHLKRFVAHEIAHWWNQGVFHSDNARPWIHEGNADWIALLLMRESGAMDAAALTEGLDLAMTRCASLRGEHPAATLPPGYHAGDDPYACGMSLMLLAHLQRAQPGDVPLRRIADLHRSSPMPLTMAGFAAWADDGRVGPMTRLLTDPKLPFAEGYVEAMQDWAVPLALRPGMALPPGLRDQMAGSLLAVLMKADCEGRVSYWTLQDGFKLDSRLSCAQLRTGQDLLTLQGLAPLRDPVAAWQTVREACAAGRPLQLRYRDGADGTASCPQPLPQPPVSTIWHLKPQALQRLRLDP